MQTSPFFRRQKASFVTFSITECYAQVAMPATLSRNQPFTILLSQHRFHVVQAIDCRAHLRLISYARCLCIGDLASKIHLHLALFLGDNGLNDRRGLFWSDVGLL